MLLSPFLYSCRHSLLLSSGRSGLDSTGAAFSLLASFML
jgi:hypothetical protein